MNGLVPDGFSTADGEGQDHQGQNGHGAETVANGHGAANGSSSCPSKGTVVRCPAASKKINGCEVVLPEGDAIPDTNGNVGEGVGAEIMRIEVEGRELMIENPSE